jgi:hypothetical protein
MWLIPSRQQWNRWSLPSKLTAVGAYLGIAGILLAIGTLLTPFFFVPRRASLAAELHLMIGGYRIRIANIGGVLAKRINVNIVSWANGAPDATIWIDKGVKDLMPNGDYFFDADLLHYGGTTGDPPGERRASSSGYILVTCNNCDKPRGWAFYIPDENSMTVIKPVGTSWPIVEFDYSNNKPHIGQVVNYPKEFSDGGWTPKQK